MLQKATNVELTTQEDFNRYFGEAAYMGKDGEPTKIDFNEDFVIAKVFQKATNRLRLVIYL